MDEMLTERRNENLFEIVRSLAGVKTALEYLEKSLTEYKTDHRQEHLKIREDVEILQKGHEKLESKVNKLLLYCFAGGAFAGVIFKLVGLAVDFLAGKH